MTLLGRMLKFSKRGIVCACLMYGVILLDFEGRLFPRIKEEPVFVRQLVSPPKLVIYNRMPFCISLALVFQSLNLVDKRFDQYSSANYNNDWLDGKAEVFLVESLLDIVTSLKNPVLYDRHVRFIDFTYYREEQPVYINILQHPVDRIFYHFIVQQDGKSIHNITQSLDQCVETGGAECTDPYHVTMSYFCGSTGECLAGDEDSLARAKKNIVRYYLLVGVEDEVKEFLWGLDRLLPSYFEGITQEVEYQESQDNSPFKRQPLPEISNHTRQLIIERHRYDYEIYLFVKQRFHAVLSALRRDTLTYITHRRLDDSWFEQHRNGELEDQLLKKYGYLDRGCRECIRSMTGL